MDPLMRTSLSLCCAAAWGLSLDVAAAGAQEMPQDLATLFELGQLVVDTNGDSVPDLVNASLVLGPSPSVAEVTAATEIAGRLGFETMAMNLPIARGVGTGAVIPIVVGRGGLTASGLATPSVDPTSLDSGEGVVAVQDEGGRPWVLVQGGDDAGLLAAARLFAGVLPHTRTLSTASLERVREALGAALARDSVAGASVRLTQARAQAGTDGIARLVVEVGADDPGAATDAIRAFADSTARGAPGATGDASTAAAPTQATDTTTDRPSTTLSFPGLASIEVRVVGGAVTRLRNEAPPEEPGPVPARPGSTAKDDLDLSHLFTSAGLLGGDPIPNRIDAILVAGDSAIAGLPELGARLGLESTGLVVPLAQPAAEVADPAKQPTMVLAGTGNRLIAQLADSGKVDVATLAPGEGLIQLVPKAFGAKPALVVTGGGAAGAERALAQVSTTFPHLGERGDDRPTVDDVEQQVWDALAGYSPVGQAAIGLYKLDRIADQLSDKNLNSARVLFSVEKAAPGLASYVRMRAATALHLDPSEVDVTIDDRDVQHAATIFDKTQTFPAETDRFWTLFRDQVLPAAASGAPITVEARLSEPPELRAQLAEEARRMLVDAGADPNGTRVRVLSAFKQGYSWLWEVVRPQIENDDVADITIRFRKNDPPPEWPQQAMQTPVRWLHEIFPIDEMLANDLGIDLGRIHFEETEDGPTYEVEVTDTRGQVVLTDAFEPKWVVRPYFDRFADYEHVRVTTGWLAAKSGNRTLVDERIVTDPEAFWDYYQSDVLPAVYDYVMERHEGNPRGGSVDAPFFGELKVDVEMSEPNYLLGLDNELHAPMDALHEEVYFGTLEFFDVLGRNARGQGLSFPGRILPIMHPKADGSPAQAHVTLTGFATSRPAVVVHYEDVLGESGDIRLDIPKTTLERPSARLAKVRIGQTGIEQMALRVHVDTELDIRDSLLTYAPHEQVDATMVSAQQVVATLKEIEGLRAAGMYSSALAFPGLGALDVWAEWTNLQDPKSRRTGSLASNGKPDPLPDWHALLPKGWQYQGQELVQWDTPIPPAEGHQILAEMAQTFDAAHVYEVGHSYLGQDVWAMDLMPPLSASHWSRVKATTFKPTVILSAREHANEVSSTSHVLRFAEILLADSTRRKKLDRVNVVIHPFTNPDGAQLEYELFQQTPDYLLHAAYQASLGPGAPTGEDDDHPIYPEAPIRKRLWKAWLPDVFLNPHGYPSRQLVQLFSEFTGLVRRGRVTERNWGFNKGWFMPGFDYVDSPDFPRHKDAALELRGYMTRGINSNADIAEMNQRAYRRYERYGAAFDPDVFRLPMTDSVMIEMPLKGSSGKDDVGGYDPHVTIWSGTSEVPDETAHGPWLQLVAKAGLSWDQAVLDYLYDGHHVVKRSGSSFFGGVSLQMERPRPPEKEEAESTPER
jgi:Zinc carboxypeptidase